MMFGGFASKAAQSLRLCLPKCSREFPRQYPAPRKRFYKNVSVTEFNGEYEINLDKRKLKTPLGNLLKIPNEALASAVAVEWSSQQETIQQHSMHLTSLCNTVIDNPCKLSKEDLVESNLEYLTTDTLCYRHRDPVELADLQRSQWDPLTSWFQKWFDVKITIFEDVINAPVPDETMAVIRKHLLTFNMWSLTGLSFAAENLKSLILTLAVVHRVIDVKTAVELSRLEVAFQTGRWGKVEWAHDLDLMQTTSRVAAAMLFVYLNEDKTSFMRKTASLME